MDSRAVHPKKVLAGPLLAVLLAALSPATSCAQENVAARPLDPPRSETGQAYRQSLRGNWVSWEAQYLPKEARLDLETGRVDWNLEEIRLDRSAGTALGYLLIAILVGTLLYLFIRYGLKGDLFAREEENSNAAETVTIDGLEKADDGTVTLDRLRSMADRREGLRLLLVHALKRAATANSVAIRRSLTARDILDLIPGNWSQHRLLGVLVKKAELVFFGGRDISKQEYEETLVVASPFFERRLR